jgi:hypothetical protein
MGYIFIAWKRRYFMATKRKFEKIDSLGEKRVGITTEERLRWVVEFAQKDLSMLRTGERLDLGEDLRLLIPTGWQGIESKPMEEAMVVRLHSHISNGIQALLASGSQKWRLPRITGLSLSKNQPEGRFYLTGEGGEFEGVVLGVFNLILRLGHRVKACPQCQKPFVAVRRQEYCSTACSQLVRDERKREKRTED